jgi:hypothetical protein
MPNSIKRELEKRGEEPEEVTVWLGNSQGVSRNFNCIRCKKTQFKHKHRVLALLPNKFEYNLTPPPVSIQCECCGTIYHVQNVV